MHPLSTSQLSTAAATALPRGRPSRPRHDPPTGPRGRRLRAAGLLAGLCFSALASAAPATLVLLDTLVTGDTTTSARDVNDQGHAVGSSGLIDGNAYVRRQASFWAGGSSTAQGLPGLPGAVGQSTANAINNQNLVVGGYEDSAARWTPSAGTPAAPQYGSPLAGLGSLGDGAHTATDVNDSGAVLGSYWKCANSDCSQGNNRSFRWDSSNGMQQVGADTGFWTYPQAINSAGDMLVANTTSGNGRQIEIVRSDGVVIPVPLGGLLSNNVGSMDMNDGRQIVGSRLVSSQWESFIWSQGVETALAAPGADGEARVYGLNNHGWVVGQATADGTSDHARLWAGAFSWDLNDLLDASEQALWDLTEAVAITDNGWIAGNGLYQGLRRGFTLKLNPEFTIDLPPNFDGGGDPQWGDPDVGGTVPTPGTLALSGLAGLALVATRRRPGLRPA